jgi:hypothetical protein
MIRFQQTQRIVYDPGRAAAATLLCECIRGVSWQGKEGAQAGSLSLRRLASHHLSSSFFFHLLLFFRFLAGICLGYLLRVTDREYQQGVLGRRSHRVGSVGTGVQIVFVHSPWL